MPPIIGLLMGGLGQLGISPGDLANRTWHGILMFLRGHLENVWLRSVPEIAKEMSDQGWKLDSVSNERPAPPEDYVGRVQYKLWHRAVPGGKVRDWLRDEENRPVTEAVSGQLDPTDHAHNIRAIIPAVLAATFDPFTGTNVVSVNKPAPGPPA